MDTLVAREERAKLAQRLRSTIRLGSWLWLGFFVTDLFAIARGAGPWWVFPLGRALPVAIGWCVYPALRPAREPSAALLRTVESLLFPMLVVAAATFISRQDGWTSHRIPTVALIIMSYAIMLGTAWRRSVLPLTLQVLALPLTLGVISIFDPALRAQREAPETIGTFVVLYSTVVGAAVIALFAGHMTWKLRQQVAEAQSMGRYKLRRRIAVGGFGEVWAAYHAGLRRDVAVKMIHADRRGDQVTIERFEREVQTLAELTHPNTVRIFDHGATETGVLYFAMELLDGKDLQALLTREGRFSCERAVRLVTQAAQALGEAHERGIVHRDVKPQNLLVLKAGSPAEYLKVIDFGIARQEASNTLTQTGMVVGTPGYIAPEVITGGVATPRADVYGLAMVLYVLLAGAVPFRGATPLAIAQQALDADPPPIRDERPDVPKELEALLVRALSRDPFLRPADGTALADALRDVM